MMSDPSKHQISFPELFQPITINATTIPNRIVMPPMVANMGVVTEQGRAYLLERARGGVGLIIIEAVPLERFHEAAFVIGLERVANEIHTAGAKVAIQLFHRGRASDGSRIAPSQTEAARAVTMEEIDCIVQEYAHAALVAEGAGLDGAELHGAHGFFMNQFFTPRINRRQDRYGRGLEGRMLFGLRCAQAVRKAARTGFLVLYRHTPEDSHFAGYSVEDSVAFAKQLCAAGVDVIDISPSWRGEESEHAGLARVVRENITLPVIAVGGMEDPAKAALAIREEKADMIAVGRGLLADPDWPEKVCAGRLDAIVKCTKCNEKCFGNLRKGLPISCTENPRTGSEYQNSGGPRSDP